MILFDLKCDGNHVFEAWFKDGKSFDAQVRKGRVLCPACGTSKVSKALMAPRVARTKGADEGGGRIAAQGVMMKALREMRQEVERNCDYVGDRFATEARKIHLGETDQRNIYGEATSSEAESLEDDGVEFSRIPWAPRTDS